MTTWRVAAAVAAAVLAAGPATAAAGAPPPPTVTFSAPTVRCPTVVPTPAPSRPPRPQPPAADPVLRTVGGEALATDGLVVPPGTPKPPAVTATSWLVADLNSGAVLGGCGPHEYGTPASVQKLLLAATVLPRLDPAQVVTVTRADLNFEPGSSAVGLLEGGKYPVGLLWTGLLLNSGNDTANVLARLGGGDGGVPGTLQAMNDRARELGAYQTRAVTPSGLDGPGQFTSAYDLALIARVCFDNADFRRYAATERAKIPAQPPKDRRGFEIQNDNQLLFSYPGAIGGKTGFTNLARHTYVGAAERNGRRLVVTLLGAEARPLRGWQQGAALLDWGFALPADASVGRLVGPGEPDPREAAEAASSAGPRVESGNRGASDGPDPALAVPASSGWSTGAAAGVAVALLAGPLVVLAVTRRDQRRRQGRRRMR